MELYAYASSLYNLFLDLSIENSFLGEFSGELNNCSVDKLVFSAPKVRNEFCLWANELAYAMNCPTGMNCAAAHKE